MTNIVGRYLSQRPFCTPITLSHPTFGTDRSQCFSLIAAGAKDGAVVVWDLHRLVCVRRLDCFGGQPVVALAFDAASGDLHVATSHAAHVFDVNLRRVLSQPLTGGDPRASGTGAMHALVSERERERGRGS